MAVFDDYNEFMSAVDRAFDACDIADEAAAKLKKLADEGKGPHPSAIVAECAASIERAARAIQENAGRLL